MEYIFKSMGPIKLILQTSNTKTIISLLKPGVNFINAKRRHFKCQILAFKCNKLLQQGLETPKSSVLITNIGISNAKSKAF